jgi:Cof subfamily protein (haloacid dehalogenase superfamily)
MEYVFPFRLAAVDLDHTLLGPDYQISEENRKAIELLQRHGVQIVLASGRLFQHMIGFHDQLELDTELICCNGAIITNRRQEPLQQELVPYQEARRLIDFGLDSGVTVYSYLRDGVYVSSQEHWNRYDQSHVGEVPVFFLDPELNEESEVTKVVYSLPADDVNGFCADIAPFVASGLDCQITGPETVEIVSLGADKALAFARLATYYGYGREQTLAFGDGANDATLLGWAGLGVAMDVSAAITIEASDLQAPEGDLRTSFARAVQLVIDQIYGDASEAVAS